MSFSREILHTVRPEAEDNFDKKDKEKLIQLERVNINNQNQYQFISELFRQPINNKNEVKSPHLITYYQSRNR